AVAVEESRRDGVLVYPRFGFFLVDGSGDVHPAKLVDRRIHAGDRRLGGDLRVVGGLFEAQVVEHGLGLRISRYFEADRESREIAGRLPGHVEGQQRPEVAAIRLDRKTVPGTDHARHDCFLPAATYRELLTDRSHSLALGMRNRYSSS